MAQSFKIQGSKEQPKALIQKVLRIKIQLNPETYLLGLTYKQIKKKVMEFCFYT